MAAKKRSTRGVRDAIQKPKARTTAPPKGYEVSRLNRGSSKGTIAVGSRSGKMPKGYAMVQGKGVSSRAASVATAKAMKAFNAQDRKSGTRRPGPQKRVS